MAIRRCTDVELASQPLGCSFHPTSPLLAVGLVSGRLLLYNVTPHTPSEPGQPWSNIDPFNVDQVLSVKAHLKGASCRAVCFADEGRLVMTGSSNHNMAATDSTTGQIVARYRDAHQEGVTALRDLGGTLVASGDESGSMKIWDTRSRSEVYSYSKHTDFITDLALNPSQNALIATSGDGTISIHDLSKRKAISRSEDDADDELLSVAVMKQGKKLVCGSQSGVLTLYSWGYFNDCSDRYPGHPMSVDALVAFDEDVLFTGSSDGVIRVVNVLPNKLLGVVGEHEGFPIEGLALGADRRVLASVSHDSVVKVWDISDFHEDSDGDYEAEDLDGGDSEDDGDEENVHKAGSGEGVEVGEREGVNVKGGRKRKGKRAHPRSDDGGSGSVDGDHDSEDQDDGSVDDDDIGGDDDDDWEVVSDDTDAAGKAENDVVGGDDKDAGTSDQVRGNVAVGSSRRDVNKDACRPSGGTSASGRAVAVQNSPHNTILRPKPAGCNKVAAGELGLRGLKEHSADSDSDSDSDGDGAGKRSKKRSKHEKTKWTKANSRVQSTSSNFFADLLDE